jgi:hypothetical protein
MKTVVSDRDEGSDISVRQRLVLLQHIFYQIYYIQYKTSIVANICVFVRVCDSGKYPLPLRDWHVFKLLGSKPSYPEDFVVYFSVPSGKCLDPISYPVAPGSFYALSSLFLIKDPVIRRYTICSIKGASRAT